MSGQGREWLDRGALERLYAKESASVAFLDETYRTPRWAGDPETSFYAMAAVIVEVERLEEVRQTALSFGTPSGSSRTWHTNEDLPKDPARARAFIEAINETGAFSTVTVHAPVPQHKQGVSLARDLVLARMATEICRGTGAPRLLVADHFKQGTNPGRAKADRELVGRMTHNGLIAEGTSLQHGHPRDEQLLWVPDLVAYAFRQHFGLGDDEWFPRFENVRTISAEGVELTPLIDPLTRRSSHLPQQGPGARPLVVPETRATAVSSDPILAWEQATDKPKGPARNNTRPRIVIEQDRSHVPGVEDHLIKANATQDGREVIAAASTFDAQKPVGRTAQRLREKLEKNASRLSPEGQERVKRIIVGPASPPQAPAKRTPPAPRRPGPQPPEPEPGRGLH